MKRALTLGFTMGLLVLGTTDAYAQAAPDVAHAKEAYARGVAAHERGDLALAAREFAAADAFAPSSVALQAALEAAVDADDPVIGGELIERSKRVASPVPPKLAQSVDAAKKQLGGRAGRVHVACPTGTTCTATVDGRSFDPKTAQWVVIGPHVVAVQLDGETQSKGVDVKGDEIVEVTPVRSAPVRPLPAAVPAPAAALADAPRAPERSPKHATTSSGLPPLVFFIGLGATVVAGAGTGYFMASTRSKHDDFVKGGCETGPAAGCDRLRRDGSDLQTTANVGIGVTAVLAVATTLVGVVFTDWNRGVFRF